MAQGICNVKCITEYVSKTKNRMGPFFWRKNNNNYFFKENVLCTIEAKQLQLDLNESGGSKKFDTMKR